MSKNLFEYATRAKLRFSSSKGELNIEQLWDVPLRSSDGFNLNTIAQGVDKTLKDETATNFVDTAKTPKHTKLEQALDVIKYVIDTKLVEEQAAKKRADNKKQKETLVAALAEKQAGNLTKKSEAELKRMIDELED
jgi:hypothetical protein